MKRRAMRTAALRLVLEDRRVDELLERMKVTDLELAQVDDRLSRIDAKIERLIAEGTQTRLPFAQKGPVDDY